MNKKLKTSVLSLLISIVLLSVFLPIPAIAQSNAKPLKVFILAGQSNMQGHANVSTIDYIGDDPKTAPMLLEMRDNNGKYRLVKDTWISYLTHGRGTPNGEGIGPLTVGFGARKDPSKDGGKIGPEFTSSEDSAIWKRGASNAAYHYLGCAKTMALIGKGFAEAMLELQARQLLHSLSRYLDSVTFAPKTELDGELIERLLPGNVQ